MEKDFKVNNFDLLRLFAAIEVLLLHSFPRLHVSYPAFFNIMSNFPGVPMFFVMSGFLISASLERTKNLKEYFKNRALRIFPALWVCLFITIIAISIIAKINFLNFRALMWVVGQCFGFIYTPSFLKNWGFGSYNGSLWTIPLELQFYIVLPLLYITSFKIAGNNTRKKSVVLFFFFLFFTIVSYFIKVYFTKSEFEIETNTQKIIRYSFIPNIYVFLLGVVLQRFKVYQSKLIFGKGIFWIISYLLINYLLPTSNLLYIFKLLFIGISTISAAYTFPQLSRKIIRGNDISYGIYIYHGLLLGVFVQLKLFYHPLYIYLLFAITIIISQLSWTYIEKPFIKRKKIKTVDSEIIFHSNSSTLV